MMSDELRLPVFDRATDDRPSPMSPDEALAAFEEIIAELKLLEKEPRQQPQFIEPFVL